VIYKIERAEIDKLSLEWCKAKHVVVMIDEVSRQFATDVANLVLKNFIDDIATRVAAKKVAKGEIVPTPEPEIKKSSLVLTDI
jgi:hypothetical protein